MKTAKRTYEELEQRVRDLERIVSPEALSGPSIAEGAPDIDKREAEAKLRESEEKFRLAFYASPDPISLNRASDGMFIDINDAFTALTGYSREEVIGKSSLELNLWDDPKDRDRLVSGLMTTGYVENLEARFRRKNGKIGIGWMSARLMRIQKEDVIVAVMHDVTERKRTAEQYRAIFENAVEGFFQSTPEGRFIRVNQALAKMCGYASPAEMVSAIGDIGRQHYVRRQDREAFGRLIDERGVVENFEHETRRKDGSTFWVSVSARAVREADGRVLYYEGSHIDIDARKKAEKLLADAGEQYRSLFDTSTNAILIRNQAGIITMVNQAAVRLLAAAKADDLIGRAYLDLVHPADRALSAERVAGVFRIALGQQGPEHSSQQGLSPREHRMVTLKGEVVDVESTGVAFPYKGELFIQGIFRDISERKRAEEELRLDDQRMEALLHLNQMTHASLQEITSFAMEEAVRLTKSRIGYLTFANEDESELTMYAWSRNAMAECAVEHKPVVYPVADTGLWGETLRQRKAIITNDYQAPSPLKRGFPNGHIRIERHLGVPIFDGDRIVIVAGVGNKGSDYNERDIKQLDLLMSGMWRIVQRTQAEEALRNSVARFRTAFENASVGMTLVSFDGIYLEVNEAMARIIGYSPADLIGKPVADFTHPDDLERRSGFLSDLISGRIASGEQERRFIHRNGSVVWTLIGASVQRDQDGKPMHFISLVQDITARKTADEDKRKLEFQLQQAQKMEAIGSLAGGIAHDFNNILAAIIGFTELSMLTEGAPVAYLREAMKAANRAKDLVKQILSFSRQTDEQRMPVHVGMVVKEIAKFLRASIPTTIDIRYTIDGRAGAVLANSVELHQILMNLCTNAVHAIGERAGIVEIEVQGMDIGPENRDVFPDLDLGHYVRLSVKDSGQGIPPEIQERMFDPYFTTKEKGVGTGLGLAVVHGIVKKSSGTIRIESEIGKGSVFHVYLPQVDLSAAKRAEYPVIPRGGSERILFVDDEKMLVDVGEQILRRLGYEVVSRTSPLEALELFKARPKDFDLVISDQTMPGLTGDALAGELMKLNPEIPVILCTGYSQMIDQRRAREKGIRALVMKPILISELAGAIRAVLDK
ncbi:MAG: PAS domain S-box protein [Deltaproteobacteria bacterium]|nr:PAS domain S-box protein [Deltaproteobacteria bacterium]